MDLISGLAELVIEASAVASAMFVDAVIISRLLGKDMQADTLAVKSAALILLFLIAFSVKVVMG
jgi:hypothetical protein